RPAALRPGRGQRRLLAVGVADDDLVVRPEAAVPDRLLLFGDVLHRVGGLDGLTDVELRFGERDPGPQALDLRSEVVGRQHLDGQLVTGPLAQFQTNPVGAGNVHAEVPVAEERAFAGRPRQVDRLQPLLDGGSAARGYGDQGIAVHGFAVGGEAVRLLAVRGRDLQAGQFL